MITDSLLSGLSTAQTQFVQSAERVVAKTADAQPQQQERFEQTLRDEQPAPQAAVSRAPAADAVMPVDTLAEDIVAMDVAAAAYRANIAAVKTWDNMMKTLVDAASTGTDEKV